MNGVIEVTPSAMAGIVSPDGTKVVSPEAHDILDRLKSHYQGMGKASAAQNYHRHLKSFFAWAEKNGYAVRGLPADSVERFLADLGAAGQKESTLYVMRTQLKSALREAHNALGLDFAHLEYQTGKPVEVRRQQKEREKQKRAERRMAMTMAQAAAIQAAQASGMPIIPAPYTPPPFQPTPMISMTPAGFDPAEIETYPATPEETPMSTPNAPDLGGATMNGAVAPHQQPVVVVQMPPQAAQRPTATVGGTKPAGTANTTSVGKSMTINSHSFTGPYVRISRMADGTDPLTPPGTETYITTVPLSQLLPHGDVAAYLQSFILPNLRLSNLVGQVHFVFHELNDRRQPTGRRDELVVSVPAQNFLGAASMAGQSNQGPSAPGLNGLSSFVSAQNGASDRATDYLLRKLDEDAAAARKRADELQERMRVEKDAQTTFLLMQQFQKEQDLRRELEDRKRAEMERANAAAAMPMMPPQMFMTPPEPPRIDSGAEMVKAMAENQAKMMEAMMVGMRPTAPQKDAMEVMLPFISAMNQQMMQQQQANQAMLMQIQQSNQQFMQVLLTRENPVEKMLLAQIQEVKASANAPKEDEMESFANKLQKMKMVSDMLGGGGSAPSLIGELLANAESIGEGAAKIIAASRSKVVLPDAPPTSEMMNGVPPALPPGPTQPSQPTPPPEAVLKSLDAIVPAAETQNDQEIVTAVVDLVRGYIDAGEPFSKIGQRLLNAFKEMEDPEEMYTFAKTLFTMVGRKPDKAVCKTVAATLVKWYEVIHEQVFGTPKKLGGVESPVDNDEGVESDESENDEDGGESDEIVVGA